MRITTCFKLGLLGLISLLSSLVISSSALAGDDDKAAKDAVDPSVQLAPVSVPVVVSGRVVNYLFLNIKVSLTPKANESKMRDMEPYFRDAIIRAAYKTSFAQASHIDKLDETRFKTVMLVEFSKITGPGGIKSIDILSQSSRKYVH